MSFPLFLIPEVLIVIVGVIAIIRMNREKRRDDELARAKKAAEQRAPADESHP